MPKAILRFDLCAILVAVFYTASGLSSDFPVNESTEHQFVDGKPVISKLMPERDKGRGYKLVYLVDAPLDVFWRFKTDFDNQFLLSNKFITSHQLISRNQNEIVTENEYSNKPKVFFRWRTTLLPDQNLLKFTLLNPEECGQKYHYGYIQLAAVDSMTRVTQVAYFDFFGVSFWVNNPFPSGMSHFLNYTATWEQQTILDLKNKYEE